MKKLELKRLWQLISWVESEPRYKGERKYYLTIICLVLGNTLEPQSSDTAPSLIINFMTLLSSAMAGGNDWFREYSTQRKQQGHHITRTSTIVTSFIQNCIIWNTTFLPVSARSNVQYSKSRLESSSISGGCHQTSAVTAYTELCAAVHISTEGVW